MRHQRHDRSARPIRRRRPARRRGSALVYSSIALIAFMGVCSLSLDAGRAFTARAELQAATDAAARYAAYGMRSASTAGTSAALANAAAVIAQNKADNAAIPFSPATDVEIGKWNGNKFDVCTLDQGANAVRVQTRMTFGSGDPNARPYTILSMLGRSVTVRAESIAMMKGQDQSSYVSAKGNPWLAGMPEGTKSDNFRPENSALTDYAGKKANDVSSPGMIDLTKLNLASGATIMFNGVTGTAGNGGGSSSTYNPDGNTGNIVNLGTANGTGAANWPKSMNGIANVKAPINGMIAVFLTDEAPNATAAPSPLDFSSATARDYTSIAPLTKQPFFVGDGRRSTGEVQQIIVPPGATRLFIGNMDAWQWNDNIGGYTATINATYSVSTVK